MNKLYRVFHSTCRLTAQFIGAILTCKYNTSRIHMIIYSWNMLYRNQELPRAFEFIKHIDFDVFCFQEVPEEFLSQLKTLPYAIAFGLDTEKVAGESIIKMYNVILSRHLIIEQGEIAFTDHWLLLPLRTKFFIFIMKFLHFSKTLKRAGLFADVIVEGQPLRVFSLHLALAHPVQRFEEFKHAMTRRDSTRQQIICGDFNILESPHITILNWLLGGRMTDALLYTRERHYLERHFVEQQLLNPLRSFVTHPFSNSQLDHILVSNSFLVTHASVLRDRLGSDHSVVRVDVSYIVAS